MKIDYVIFIHIYIYRNQLETLTAYAPDDDSSSDDNSDGQNDQEDIVSLGRSSSITASVSSIYSNIFLGSNASR